MIVLLEDDIFASPHNRLDLLTVLQLGFMSWHWVQTDPPYEPLADRNINRWLHQRDEETRKEVELALEIGMEQAVFGLSSDLSIRIGDVQAAEWANPPRLPLPEALRLLHKPLRLLVENQHNDGAFLLAVAPSPWRSRLDEALAQGRVEIGHGGGSDMKTQLDKASLEEGLRLWALFDSDAREPGRPSAASEALRQICLRKGIPYHQLSRRASENYLPVQALQAWAHTSPGNLRASRRRRTDAFASMRPDQRYHYNMKHGFQGDRKDSIPPHYGTYADHADLQNGFGGDIASLYYQEHFPVREEWLAKDGQQAETLAMVQSILKRL